MGSVTDLAEKRKSRSSEAAKTKNISLVPSIPQNDTDYSYIFSKKADEFIDNLCPWILGLTALYFAGQLVRMVVRVSIPHR